MGNAKDTKFSSLLRFLFGFGLSVVFYFVSTFLFFLFANLRRVAVLSQPFKLFDSDVAFSLLFIPVVTAIPWLPFAIITGLIFWKKGKKPGLRYLYIFTTIITIALAILFWNLPYN